MRADQHAEQRRLAGAVRADDADRLAGADGEVDAVEHHQRAEALGQAFRVEQKAVRPGAGTIPASRSAVSCCNGMSFAAIGTFGSVAFSVDDDSRA